MREICRESWAPSESTVRGWGREDSDFAAQYARARAVGYEKLADELLEISDDSSSDTISTEQGERPNSEWISRSRLRVDTRKWLLSKMLPKVYGDKLAVESSGPDGGPIQHEVQAVHSIDPVAASQVYQKFMEGGG